MIFIYNFHYLFIIVFLLIIVACPLKSLIDDLEVFIQGLKFEQYLNQTFKDQPDRTRNLNKLTIHPISDRKYYYVSSFMMSEDTKITVILDSYQNGVYKMDRIVFDLLDISTWRRNVERDGVILCRYELNKSSLPRTFYLNFKQKEGVCTSCFMFGGDFRTYTTLDDP